MSFLEDLDTDALVECNLPQLPFRDVWRIKTFFKNVVQKHHSEASVSLYYNKQTKQFKVFVPEQRVSHGSVSYKMQGTIHLEGLEDFLRVGTIHSHCDFGAFHSGTDIGDEEEFDGLHITFGHNNLSEFSISASIVVNGKRALVEPLQFLEGVEPVPNADGRYRLADLAPELEEEWSQGLDDWMAQVHSHNKFTLWGVDNEKFRRGDKVSWAGDLSTVSFKDQCGDGPFEVDSARDGFVTVVTKVGLARFSEKLFKRV